MMTTNRHATAATELLAAAKAMLEGREDLIEGVRKIHSIGMEIDPDNEAFMLFKAIDSDTDNFPVGAVRTLWSTEELAKADEEKAKYLADTRNDILAGCQEIIRLYS
jgi:hypothetical protein